MKWTKRVTAFILSLLILLSVTSNVFAETETTGVPEPAEVAAEKVPCEECGELDLHLETCSYYEQEVDPAASPVPPVPPAPPAPPVGNKPPVPPVEGETPVPEHCPECKAPEGHLPICSQFAAEQTPDYSADIGKYAAFNAAYDKNTFGVVFTEPTNLDIKVANIHQFKNVIFEITDFKVIEGKIGHKLHTALFYQVDIIEGEVNSKYENGFWILQNYLGSADHIDVLTLSAPPVVPPVEDENTTPVFSTPSTTVSGVDITVEGSLTSGSTLSASSYTVTSPGAFGLTDTSNIKASYDIKILDANGNATQPSESVFVSLDAAAMGLSNGAVVELIHQHGASIEKSIHVIMNGKLIFPVSGFSVFIVNSLTDTTGTQITGNTANNPYIMTVGESEIFFDSYGGGGSSYTAVSATIQQMYNNRNSTTYYYWIDGAYREVEIGRSGGYNNYRYSISYADGSGVIVNNLQGNNRPTGYYTRSTTSTAYRGEWQVADESNAISYEITSVNYQNNQHMAPYISVTAKDIGDVVLTYKYVNGNNIRQETLYIRVVASEDGFKIDDQVPETGCLVPVGLESVEGVKYSWARSDGQTIRSESLSADGTINVSLDRGGLTEGRNPITYTVTATLVDGSTKTASYEVLYSNEILNSSFENTVVNHGLTNQYFYNGYPGLYWKTTTPGSTTGQLTQDIEIITTANGGNPAGSYGSNVTSAAHGNQFAEINAEGFGALYQDILTTSGSDLNWSFSHLARTYPQDSENTMYVVIGATKDAQSIIDFDDINALLTSAKNRNGNNIPSSGSGASFTHNGSTYYIWKHVGTRSWETISGTYNVPNDQYLTRLFFVSETANAARVNETCGNLIDAVSAGETMDYRIEYYADGNLVNTNTQRGKATVYTTVALEHLRDYLNDGYVLTAAKLKLKNGDVDYPGNLNSGLYITSYGDSGDDEYEIIVKVYFAKRAVTITKNIVIEGWEDMSDDERSALIGKGLTSKFELKSDSKTYNATLTIIAASSTGELTAIGEFVDSNGKPPVNGTYTVTETSYPTISGFALKMMQFDHSSITLSDSNPTAAIVCTNTYDRTSADLTITKSVENGLDENQSFIFDIEGPNDFKMTVTINGESSVTIKDLPVGKYTVIEDTKWSWRYGPKDYKQEITLQTNADNTLEFKNKRDFIYWLSGDCLAENQFTVVNKKEN